jgi:hypothetical protein
MRERWNVPAASRPRGARRGPYSRATWSHWGGELKHGGRAAAAHERTRLHDLSLLMTPAGPILLGRVGDLLFDYSKTNPGRRGAPLLIASSTRRRWAPKRDRHVPRERINETEAAPSFTPRCATSTAAGHGGRAGRDARHPGHAPAHGALPEAVREGREAGAGGALRRRREHRYRRLGPRPQDGRHRASSLRRRPAHALRVERGPRRHPRRALRLRPGRDDGW